MDEVSEAHLAEVHPELARRIRLLSDKCSANGIIIRVTQGLRTWAEQDALYAQSRTAPGPDVTNARGGYSMHNFGLAVDIAPGLPGYPKFVPDWNAMDYQWKQILMMAISCDLAEGATWRTRPDDPHLYPKELPADPDDEMRYVFQEKGLQALWDELKLTPNV